MTPLGPSGIQSRLTQIQARIDALSSANVPTGQAAFVQHLSNQPLEPNIGNLSGPIGGGDYRAMAESAAQRHGLDPALFLALVEQESGGNPNAESSAGAQGLCQLMPKTAASLGVTDRLDPVQSLEGGAKYLRQMLDQFGGDPARALAAYNAGPGYAAKAPAHWPAETKSYVRTILAHAGVAA